MSKTVTSLKAQTISDNTAYLDAMGDSQQNAWLVKVHIGSQETTFKNRYRCYSDSHIKKAP